MWIKKFDVDHPHPDDEMAGTPTASIPTNECMSIAARAVI